MLQDIEKKDLNSLLKQGAAISDGHSLWLFWGQSHGVDERPLGPAIFSLPFFHQQATQWQVYEHVAELPITTAKGRFQEMKSHLPEIQWQSPDSKKFAQQFQWVQEQIQNQGVKKLVPYSLEEGSFSGMGPQQLAAIIAQSLNFKEGYLFGQWNEGVGFLGRTPEVLIQQNSSSEFSTMALAGTANLDDFKVEPEKFLNDPKQIQEHQWVVDDLNEVLKNFGDVQVAQRQCIQTPSLVHFQTDIQLKTQQPQNLDQLIFCLHPTPALGVYPRERSMDKLKQLNEWLPREELGAPFGMSYSSEQALILVGIRKLHWTKNQIKIASGCGVVEKSQLAQEWQELADKRNSVKKLFGVL